MQPYNLMDLLLPLQTVTKEVVLYLPRTSDLRQFVRFERKGKKLPVIHYCMEGASKVRQALVFILSVNQQFIGIVCILRRSLRQHPRRGCCKCANTLNDVNGNTRFACWYLSLLKGVAVTIWLTKCGDLRRKSTIYSTVPQASILGASRGR